MVDETFNPDEPEIDEVVKEEETLDDAEDLPEDEDEDEDIEEESEEVIGDDDSPQ